MWLNSKSKIMKDALFFHILCSLNHLEIQRFSTSLNSRNIDITGKDMKIVTEHAGEAMSEISSKAHPLSLVSCHLQVNHLQCSFKFQCPVLLCRTISYSFCSFLYSGPWKTEKKVVLLESSLMHNTAKGTILAPTIWIYQQYCI